MTTRVGFLRAANVGQRRVAMARLAEVVRDAGFEGVSTYINSGNVIFSGTGARVSVEKRLEGVLEEAFGFELTTFVRTAAELDTVLAEEPFELGAGDTHFVTFLKRAPTATQVKGLEALSGDFDTLVVVGSDVHWRMHGRSSDSPLVRRDWERVLGPLSSTSRNTTMLRKLVAKLG